MLSSMCTTYSRHLFALRIWHRQAISKGLRTQERQVISCLLSLPHRRALQGSKVVLVDHAAQHLLVSGQESDARYPLGAAGGILARIARTAVPELLRNPAAYPAFRRHLDGSDVALDDMLVVPIMRGVGGGAGGGSSGGGKDMCCDGGGGGGGGGSLRGSSVRAGEGTNESQNEGGRLAHPDVIAVMQVRTPSCHDGRFCPILANARLRMFVTSAIRAARMRSRGNSCTGCRYVWRRASSASKPGTAQNHAACVQATNKRRGMLSAPDLAACARLAPQASYMLQLAAHRAAVTAAASRAAALSAVLQRISASSGAAVGGGGGGMVAAGVLNEFARDVLGAFACHLVPSQATTAAEGWTCGDSGTVKVRKLARVWFLSAPPGPASRKCLDALRCAHACPGS